MIRIGALVLGAYLLGSVPFGVLIARAHGVDLRKVGSGNTGATNVARALGKRWAYVCFVLDCLKGLAPTAVAGVMLDLHDPSPGALTAYLAVGCAAVIGHIYSVFLRFRGGKGAATGMGVMLGLWPYYTAAGVVTFIVWLICVLIWRYVSLATITASAAFPIALCLGIVIRDDWQFAALWPLVLAAVVMSLLVIARHAENIRRLINGTEAKVLQR